MKKTTGKEIFSLALCIVLFLSVVFSVRVNAEEESKSQATTVQGKNFLEYMRSDTPKILLISSEYEYIKFVNDIRSDVLSQYFVHMADKFAGTGVEPGEEKYREVLFDIIQTYDMDRSGAIAEQNKMDNLKNFADYGKDVIDIGKSAVSHITKFSPETNKLQKNIKSAIDALSTMTDVVEDMIVALSDLETLTQNYSYYIEFLEIIEENADGSLKAAAIGLKRDLRNVMLKRLEIYNDLTTDTMDHLGFGPNCFNDMFLELCKYMEEYENDESFQWIVDSGASFQEKVKVLESSWGLGKKIGILIGNLIVSGENLANRLMETMAVKDIGEVLSGYLQNMVTEEMGETIGTEKETAFVEEYVAVSELIVGCRVRGEYCWYSIIANDAGLLSWFNQETGKKAEDIYKSRIDLLESAKARLEGMLEIDGKYVIDRGAYWYRSGEYLSTFDIAYNGIATIDFWTGYGAGNGEFVEFFTFPWQEERLSYQVRGKKSGNMFYLTFLPVDESTIRIRSVCEKPCVNWQTEVKDKVWLDGEYEKIQTNGARDYSEEIGVVNDEKSETTFGMSVEELCRLVGDHYNAETGTTDYVVYTPECREKEDCYVLDLRYCGENTPINTANVLVGMVTVDKDTGVAASTFDDEEWTINE